MRTHTRPFETPRLLSAIILTSQLPCHAHLVPPTSTTPKYTISCRLQVVLSRYALYLYSLAGETF